MISTSLQTLSSGIGLQTRQILRNSGIFKAAWTAYTKENFHAFLERETDTLKILVNKYMLCMA